MAEELKQTMHKRGTYDESKIRHLDDTEHIRTRPGMYICLLYTSDAADEL